jgi:hypothetical protein
VPSKHLFLICSNLIILSIMKNIRFVAATVGIAALSFLGCKNNVAPPEIKFGDTPLVTVKAGESKEVAVSVKTEGKLKRVSFFRKNNNGEEELFGTPIVKFPNKAKYESILTLQDITVGVSLIVEAVDAKDQTSRAEYVITVDGVAEADKTATAVTTTDDAPATPRAVSTYRGGGIEVGFNSNNEVGSSFSVTTGTAMLLREAREAAKEVDFMFFNGRINGLTIAAPSDESAEQVFNNTVFGVKTWCAQNATVLVKVSTSFSDATLADVESQLAGGSTKANGLRAGDVVGYKTVSGSIGVIKLINVDYNASVFNINVKTLN